MNTELEIVNAVGSGELQREFDLEALASDLNLPEAQYNTDMNALLIRFEEDGHLIILYSSGKYIARGGNDLENLEKLNNQLLSCLDNLGISYNQPQFGINNLVCIGDLDKDINLNNLMLQIGYENAEFEPEQFPGLVFHPDNYDCAVIIFNSGKIVITGLRDMRKIEKLYLKVKSIVNDL